MTPEPTGSPSAIPDAAVRGRNGSFVSHLESAIDGTPLPARTLQTTHAGKPLWVRYDLEAVRRHWSPAEWRRRPAGMWRYRELLPAERPGDVVSLGETETPLLSCPRLGRRIGAHRLLVKDESRLPTGSFKARGMAMAVTMARELGVERFAVPTAGNAGGALAAYAARAGMPCWVFMPEDTPVVNRCEAPLHGARGFLVNGLIGDCGRVVREGAERIGWFDMSTLREPYRIEGKKTMGLELADQMGWRLPDVILYPTGGGTGLIGMWKAFAELDAIGALESSHMPRLYSCQSSGCAPIAEAFAAGERFSTPPAAPHTMASGLRVPAALGDFMILDAVRESGGKALAADESRLEHWMRTACADEGVALCPETAACLDVLQREIAAGAIDGDETIVVYNTAAVQKYVEAMDTVALPRVDHRAPDWTAIGADG
ncbi:MAG: threonine synthase [Planctomycetota bacterium]|jgi:threonine synthase